MTMDMSGHPSITGYELLQLHGRGFHLIYLARQSSSGRLVHLHVFGRSGVAADELRQQAALLATLDHPNIIRAVELGDSQDCSFSALEYAGGGRLAEKIRSGPVHPAEAVFLARDIASALQYARKQGAFAFNLTPSSVLLTEDGVAKLANFRPLSVNRVDGLEGFIFGTPSYAAPEEFSDARGVEQAPSTDVYRIGAVLYATLTGQPPIARGKDPIATLRRVAEQRPAPIWPQNKAVPADLELVCMKCLEKSPTLRYSQPVDLVGVFDQFLEFWPHRAEPNIAADGCRDPCF